MAAADAIVMATAADDAGIKMRRQKLYAWNSRRKDMTSTWLFLPLRSTALVHVGTYGRDWSEILWYS